MSSNEKIAELAYQLWDSRGRPHGSAEQDWREAERRLASDDAAPSPSGASAGAVDAALEATFPASDPAASHTPDAPPANAEAKWAAAGKTRPEKSEDAPGPPRSKTRSKSAAVSASPRKSAKSARSGPPPGDDADGGPKV